MATEVFLNGGKDASTNGVVGFVYCPCSPLPPYMLSGSNAESLSRGPQQATVGSQHRQ